MSNVHCSFLFYTLLDYIHCQLSFIDSLQYIYGPFNSKKACIQQYLMRTDASPFLPRMGFVIVFPFSVHSFNAVESLLLRHIVSFCNTFDTVSPVSTDKYIDTVRIILQDIVFISCKKCLVVSRMSDCNAGSL